MDLKQVQAAWERFGSLDPMWAVLSHPDKTNNRWDVDEFFRTGIDGVEASLGRLAALGRRPTGGRALDFGCGVGRLSQALCRRFDAVVGVDIAESMIAAARKHNRHGDKCLYRVNPYPDLRQFEDESFDFVLTHIVLQHMRPENSSRYIQEFLRLLKRGGVLVFQIPSHALDQAVATATAEPLPPEAFRAEIEVLDPPQTLRPAEPTDIRVRVANRSPVVWPASPSRSLEREVRIGNHWLTRLGDMIQLDDGRASLPGPLAPGASTEVNLTIAAPAETGTYQLAVDTVQELVSWFGDQGSVSWTGPVEVVGRSTDRPPGAPIEPHKEQGELDRSMWMDGIPKDEVLRLVQDAGGSILAAEPDSSAPGWASFFYYVVKDPS